MGTLTPDLGSTMNRTSPSFSPDSSSFSNDNSFDDVSQGLEEKQLTIRNLIHISSCSADLTIGGTCASSRTCYAVRTLYNHVSKCTFANCYVPKCGIYRSAFHHIQKCSADVKCRICEPARSEYCHFFKPLGGPPPMPPQSKPPSAKRKQQEQFAPALCSSSSSRPRLSLGTRRVRP
jgi:hypothetical protein